jgi:hypothetical protein
VTLPKDVRPGQKGEVFFNAVRRDDGVIELRPQVTIDASKAWFWSDRWQRMEQEVQVSYDSGDFQRHNSGEEFLAHLDKLSAQSKGRRRTSG